MKKIIIRIVHIMLLATTLVFIINADEILSTELTKGYKESVDMYLESLKENPNDIDTLKELGKSYFYIAVESKNLNFNCKAMKIFKKILKKEPDNAEILAYYGSCYTLLARDFPLKWITSLTPLGFLRIYYVNRGVSILEKATKLDPQNPFVRIICANTYYGLPGVFGKFDKSIKEFELLLSWIENPNLNQQYSDLLSDESFQSVVLYNAANAFIDKGEKDKAKKLLEKILSISVETPYKEAAKRRLNKLNEQKHE